jgi:hypothetical protein
VGFGRLLRIERQIATADGSTIRRRWVYGQQLLADPSKMSASGQSLRRGVLQQLIHASRDRGHDLSEREIRYRLQAARTYPEEAQIGSIAADYRSWRALCDAGFPPVTVPDDVPEGAVLDAEESDTGDGWTQLDLFPSCRQNSTLEEAQRYHKSQSRMTANFVALDRRRGDLLDRMINAVGGDLTATLGEAVRALGGPDEDEGDGG